MLETVERQSKALQQHISNINDATFVDIHKRVMPIAQMSEDVQSIKDVLQEIRSQQDSAAGLHYNALSEQFGIEAQNALRPILKGVFEDFERRLEYVTQEMQARQFLDSIDLYRRAITPSPMSGMMTTKEFLHALAVDPMGMTDDLQTILRARQQLDRKAHLHTSHLMQNDRFRRWCSSTDPDSILVDASMVEGMATSKISPLSSACASIIASIIKAQPEAIPLFFFCGLHTSPQDPLRGPSGLLRTFIARLLIELDGQNLASLDFIDTRGFQVGGDAQSIPSLCYAFKRLMYQWPLNTVVYCIIDGIGWCENTECSEDLSWIMDLLHDLVGDPQLRSIFKVLISNPLRNRTMTRRFQPVNQIIMRAEAGSVREEFPPERAILLNQAKAEFSRRNSEASEDDDFYT